MACNIALSKGWRIVQSLIFITFKPSLMSFVVHHEAYISLINDQAAFPVASGCLQLTCNKIIDSTIIRLNWQFRILLYLSNKIGCWNVFKSFKERDLLYSIHIIYTLYNLYFIHTLIVKCWSHTSRTCLSLSGTSYTENLDTCKEWILFNVIMKSCRKF